MKTHFKIPILTCFLMLIALTNGWAQGKQWSLDDCIGYALEHNIQIQKAGLTNEQNEVLTNKAKANRLPSVSASVSENFGWDKSLDEQTNKYGNLSGSNSTNYSVSSSVTLYNGLKLQNTIKQSGLNLESGKLYAESERESVQLSILNAFLQVIYDDEEVKNAQKQIEATTEELSLAKERLDLNAISRSDYLQIQSELASEKLTLANANSQFSMAKVDLMQLMELPVTNDFSIVSPNIETLLQSTQSQLPVAKDIYEAALKFKPQIKSAELTTESAKLDIEIAKAGLLPTVSMDAGLGTGYSSLNTGFDYPTQLNNSINPTLGLTLSIPIFQKNQVKSNIQISKISVSDAQLDELNTRNQLRKDIEQACVDAVSARTEYEASVEQHQSTKESYDVSSEKFKQGMLNAVDFLFEKTKLITAESELLQSKYKLVFSNKILDFYKGVPLKL